MISMLVVYMSHEWTFTRFFCYLSFVGVTSGCGILLVRYAAKYLTGNDFYL